MKGIPDDVLARLGGTCVTLSDIQPGPLDPLLFMGTHVETCEVTRDLLGAVQTCELGHHNDSLAHRMTNPDGSVTTWRN